MILIKYKLLPKIRFDQSDCKEIQIEYIILYLSYETYLQKNENRIILFYMKYNIYIDVFYCIWKLPCRNLIISTRTRVSAGWMGGK